MIFPRNDRDPAADPFHSHELLQRLLLPRRARAAAESGAGNDGAEDRESHRYRDIHVAEVY